ncbi:hypothetical protein C8Q80DRAFT_1155251 [Daedaleopsis nitida]|nr:hypothetical protein C8Q80DRAFT_1155251 [Daedaleopsis nitida]
MHITDKRFYTQAHDTVLDCLRVHAYKYNEQLPVLDHSPLKSSTSSVHHRLLSPAGNNSICCPYLLQQPYCHTEALEYILELDALPRRAAEELAEIIESDLIPAEDQNALAGVAPASLRADCAHPEAALLGDLHLEGHLVLVNPDRADHALARSHLFKGLEMLDAVFLTPCACDGPGRTGGGAGVDAEVLKLGLQLLGRSACPGAPCRGRVHVLVDVHFGVSLDVGLVNEVLLQRLAAARTSTRTSTRFWGRLGDGVALPREAAMFTIGLCRGCQRGSLGEALTTVWLSTDTEGRRSRWRGDTWGWQGCGDRD